MLYFINDMVCKYKVLKLPYINISPTARVAYRKIHYKYKNVWNNINIHLTIGGESIIDGALTFECDDSVIQIGKNSFMGGASRIICSTRIEIGDDVMISWGCSITDHNSHSLYWRQRCNDVRDWYNGKKDWTHVKRQPVRIENKAWIGFNTIILKGVTIGEGAVVGAGSVVTKDAPPYTIVAGNPARIIREIPLDEL
jgi:galactoside O-acetyltransferase